MEISARELRLRHGDFIVVPSFTWRVPHSAGQYLSDKEKKLAMHAGHAETALMLALAPETVHMDKAVTNYPAEFPSKLLSPDGRPACAWSARDFGPSGIIGDPLPATREQGLNILDSLANSWAQAITELHELTWAPRAEATWGRAQHQGHVQTGLA
jgi:creatinine amidohydrolase